MGAVGVWFKVPAIIVSLFFMFIFGGLQLLLMAQTGKNTISLNDDFSVLMNPVVIVVAIAVIAILTTYLFYYTRLGKYAREIGSNETVAAQAGVNTLLWKVLANIAYAVLSG
jgi:ribose transport system permease protein